MVDRRLLDFISSQLEAGHSADDIRNALIKKGWSEKDVDEALADYEKPKKTEKHGGKGISVKLLILAMVIIVVIAAAVAFLIIPPPEPECGNGVCEAGETYLNCPDDCPEPPETGLALDPATQTVGVGNDVSVNLMIYDASNLYGFQASLNYDSNILQFKETEEGAFLSENGEADTFYMPPDTSTPGLLHYIGCTRRGQIGGLDGDGLLVKITFTALAPGTSSITLSEIGLSDPDVNAIPYTSSDGEIVVV